MARHDWPLLYRVARINVGATRRTMRRVKTAHQSLANDAVLPGFSSIYLSLFRKYSVVRRHTTADVSFFNGHDRSLFAGTRSHGFKSGLSGGGDANSKSHTFSGVNNKQRRPILRGFLSATVKNHRRLSRRPGHGLIGSGI